MMKVRDLKVSKQEILSRRQVVQKCIEKDWYTDADISTYEDFIDWLNENESFPASDNYLLMVAVDIWNHSDKVRLIEESGLSAYEMIECILWELSKDCVTRFYSIEKI